MTAKRRLTVRLISLGCSKNLVDSERLSRMLADHGIVCVTDDATKADVAIINTCGFIGDAKEESVNEILAQIEQKKRRKLRRVYVMGCLSQRYAAELPEELPEVDGWYGKFDWPGVIEALADLNADGSTPCESKPYDRVLTTGPHHAYLKIAEGCNRFCAFCAIPLITGRYTSRPIEEIVDEVKMLVDRGVHEFNVIAQELTAYGTDLYGRQRIADLIDAIAEVDGVKWIRLHYAYPTNFPMEMLDAMERHPNVCRYLDIALQHISDPVLENMRRHITGYQTRTLLDEIRRRVPGIHIRTTLMVGFPGEGEREFEELKRFVEEQRFERMGAFAYCEEDDTWAARNLDDSVPQEVKQRRLDELMAIQERIALEHNQSKVGTTLDVVVDRKEDDYYVCRSEFDSPEVDPEVLLYTDKNLAVGQWVEARITDAMPFELIATI